MKAKWFFLLIAGSGSLLLAERTFADPVVYDNTATYLGTAHAASIIEEGNEITLAGSGRLVTSVVIAVEITGEAPATVQPQLTLYTNDGLFAGSPLWQSDIIPQQIEPGAPRFITFAVPGVRVPNTFIWTAQRFGVGSEFSLSQFHPPAVGSVRYGYWRVNQGPSPWLFYEGAPFGAVVTVDPEIPAISRWGLLLLTLALVSAGTVVIMRANRRVPSGRSVGGAALLPALSFSAWAFSAAAQVQVGPQIHIDVNGGFAAANETSIASSNFNPHVIVAAWNDWRDSPPNPPLSQNVVRVGVAVTNDGGATWNDFLLRPPVGFRNDVEADPMTAYDDRTGTLWVGGISFPFSGGVGGIFVARKDPWDPALQESRMALPASEIVDKGWMAAGPAPGNPNATNVYIAYGGAYNSGGVIRSTTMGNTWNHGVSLGS
ncbi:MAG: hypothetical protein Q7R41_09765, partial [Phycisphaerales bacterium]|nr:hypothetical protein [Phycisphaerales bacterium]